MDCESFEKVLKSAKKTDYKLPEVATIERAVKGKVYPAGVTLIELSATSGAFLWQSAEGEVEPRYAVLIPKDGINKRYFYEVIGACFPKWYHKYKTTMNIQIEALNHFEVRILDDRNLQNQVALILQNLDNQIQEAAQEYTSWLGVQKYYLDGMFPNMPAKR